MVFDWLPRLMAGPTHSGAISLFLSEFEMRGGFNTCVSAAPVSFLPSFSFSFFLLSARWNNLACECACVCALVFFLFSFEMQRLSNAWSSFLSLFLLWARTYVTHVWVVSVCSSLMMMTNKERKKEMRSNSKWSRFLIIQLTRERMREWENER